MVHPRRCYLEGREGDAANVILPAVGHNFGRILAWLRKLLRFILILLRRAFVTPVAISSAF